MKRLQLAMLVACSTVAMAGAAAAAAQESSGDFAGTIEPTPGTRVPLIVHIAQDDVGALRGTMDSPTQGVQGLALGGIRVEGNTLAFAVPPIGGYYSGEWLATIKAWRGEWSQAGMKWPLVLFALPPAVPPTADWKLPSDDAIAELIAERNAPRAGQGIVVGVLGQDGQRFVAGGTGAGSKVDSNTLFEIGSITKVFTALILADMVNKGEVSLDDPAVKYLPKGHHMPERGGRQITLRDLSTHRSGLPRDPTDMVMANPADPFAYSEEKLLAFLDGYQLTRDIGSKWQYSNLGVGLLGLLLARAAHTDYETLLRKRVTAPLGMKDTLIALSAAQAARLAPAFDANLQPVKPRKQVVLKGAGALHSTAADMLIFAEAVLDPKSPIASAVNTALSVRVPGQAPEVDQALGWRIMHPAPGREILQHGGSTSGYRAMLVLEPAKGRAVVALANSGVEPATDDLALHILIGLPVGPTPPIPPAPPPPPKHTAISLPVAQLDKLVGSYDFGNSIVIVITRYGSTLGALREDSPALPIFPEAPLMFFWTAFDAQIRFITDASGAVTGAELTQGGQSLTGKRMEP